MSIDPSVVGGHFTLNTGHKIPLIGLGTCKITGDAVKLAVDAALTAGYRMFDTAKYYFNEADLGHALEELLPNHKLTRTDIFIISKAPPAETDVENEARKSVEQSLTYLKTSYIDLYLIHYPKPQTFENDDPRNAEYRKRMYLELEKMKEEGLIKSIGVSNFEIKHIKEIKLYGKMSPCVNQVEYHPHFTRNELFDYCKNEGIFLQAFASLGRHDPALIDEPTVIEMANKHKTSVPSILLAFAHSQGIGIVPKSSTPSRIIENLKVASIKLSQDDIISLKALNRNKNYIARCRGWLVQ